MKELSINHGKSEELYMLHDKAMLQVDGSGKYEIQASLDGEHWSVYKSIAADCKQHSRTVVVDLLAGVKVRVVCVTGHMEAVRYAFSEGVLPDEIIDSEHNRIVAEAARIEAEQSREVAEQQREEAEQIREVAEASRVEAEANREAEEAHRVSEERAREQAEAERVSTFETNEAQRIDTFNRGEAEREKADAERASNEEARQQTFVANEATREETFETNEEARQRAFENNEYERTPRIRFNSNNEFEASYDKGQTWQTITSPFASNIKIEGYVDTVAQLPTDKAIGTVYGVKDAEFTAENPKYRVYVYTSSGWVDNGLFGGISAGVVQETGDGENVVMSQKAVSGKLAELLQKVDIAYGKNLLYDGNLTEGYLDYGGRVKSNSDYCITNYIRVDADSEYILSNDEGSYPAYTTAYWVLYDSVLNVLKVGNTSNILTPSDTKYIRCSLYKSAVSEKLVMLEKGNVRGDYEASNPIQGYIKHLVDNIEDVKSNLESEVYPRISKCYTGEHEAYRSILFSQYPLKAGGKIVNKGKPIQVYDLETDELTRIASGTTYTLPADVRGGLLMGPESGVADFEYTYYAMSKELEGYSTKEELEDVSEKLIDVEAEIGRYTEEIELRLQANAYSSINGINIPINSIINSNGGYNKEILLCPEEKFTANNYVRIDLAKVPYTTPFEVKSVRPINDIDNIITYIIPATGIHRDIELLSTKVENLPGLTIKPIGSVYRGGISAGQTVILEKNSVKGDESFAFSGNITSFGKIILGRGMESEKLYSSSWVEIDNTNIVHKTYYTTSQQYENTYPHGLTITNNIQVLLYVGYDGKATITLASNGQMFQKTFNWNGYNGSLFLQSENDITDASFSWTCKKLNSDIWLFGDSYFSLNSASRWTSYLLSNGYKNLLLNAYPGENSSKALADFQALLAHRTPKYVVWCMGMNDADSDTAVSDRWLTSFNTLRELCESNNIALIATTTPTVKGGYVEDTENYQKREHKYKNEVVKNSGLRYIDFYSAVVENGETGEWYGDMLYSDGVHTSESGAITFFMKAISDCPELLAADNY